MQEVAKASESSVKDAGEIKKSEIAYLLKLMSSKDLRSAAKEKEEEEISKTEKRDILEKEREMLERDMKDLHYELDKTMHEMQHLYRIISETSSQKPLNDKESMEHALVNLEHHSLNIRNQLSIIHHRLEVLRQDLES